MKIICLRCKKEKEDTAFYRCSRRKNGRQVYCKQCTLEVFRVYRRSEKHKAYRREYHRRKHVVERIKRYQNRPEVKIRRDAQIRASQERHKRAYKARYRGAHNQIGNALRRGLLARKPCSVCGKERAEAHHPNYKKPLEVIWLCRKHHKELHRLYGERLSRR